MEFLKFSKATWLCIVLATTVSAQSKCPASDYGPTAGVIESPGFAQHVNYGNDMSCTYNIKVAEGSKILLTVNSLITETCCDRVYVYDGPNTHSRVLIIWSGHLGAGSFVESTGNVVTVTFQSDNTVNAAGFSIRYAPSNAHLTPTTTAKPTLQIVNWKDRSTYWNSRPSPTDIHALVLHHTVDPTVQATYDALNNRHLSVHYIAAKNGTIYQLVDEANRAWHAGTGTWGSYTNMNDISIGIEIVNTGDEPFPTVQENAVAELSAQIVKRWKILPKNIVAHADFQEYDKTDVSGYFDFKLFYAALDMYPGLYTTKLSESDQKKVLYQASTTYSAAVKSIQERLQKYGYYLTADGIFGSATQLVVEAFNRHYCPEIFKQEEIVNGNEVRFAQNKRWYGISEERLAYLVAHS
uniref:N-acetylmuramoyl-L-alanine amidase n=1 Tax=Plectus sambesii TaxID=2011161 RepID=A0A914VWF9_9BILA